eukprot:3213973-Amphidinium_carterae.1
MLRQSAKVCGAAHSKAMGLRPLAPVAAAAWLQKAREPMDSESIDLVRRLDDLTKQRSFMMSL